MKLARLTTMVLAAVIAAVLVAHAQSKDPFVGTWTLNAAKSKYTPGPRRRASRLFMKPRARDTR